MAAILKRIIHRIFHPFMLDAVLVFALFASVTKVTAQNHLPEVNIDEVNSLIPVNPDSAKFLCFNYLDNANAPAENENNLIYFLLGKTFFKREIYDSALIYAQLASELLICKNKEYQKYCAENTYIMGSCFYKFQLADSSIYYLTLSSNLSEELKADSLLSLSLKQLGNAFLIKGEVGQAFANYQKAMKSEFSRSNPDEKTLSGIYQNIGIIYANTGLFDSAAIYFRKSLNLKESYLDKDDPNLGVGYLNMGYFLFTYGDIIEALEYINHAEEIYHQNFGADYEGLAPIYFNKGAILLGLYNYDESLVYHELAIDLYKKHFPEKTDNIFPTIYSNLGLLYEGKEDFRSAVKYLEMSRQLSEESKQSVKDLRILGRCYLQLGEYEPAKLYLELSLEKAKEYYGEMNVQYAISLLNIGNYYQNVNEYQKSIEYMHRSLEIFIYVFGEKNREIANVYTNLGSVSDKMNEYRDALNYYQYALITGVESFNDTSVFVNPEIDDIPSDFSQFLILRSKVRSLLLSLNTFNYRRQVLEFALETTQLSIELLNRITSSFNFEKTKLLIGEKSEDIYDIGVYLCDELYNQTGNQKYFELGFEFTEKGKAAVLLEGIRGTEALEFSGLPDQLSQFEKLIKKEIANYSNLIYDEELSARPDSGRLAKWKAGLFVKRDEYDSLINLLERDYPAYYNLKYNKKVVDLKFVQASLGNDDALIEYNLTDTLLYAFIVDKDKLLLERIAIDSLFYRDVRSFVGQVSTFPEVENAQKNGEAYARLGNHLFQKLLPSYHSLGDKTNLYIIPDNILGYLSFEALVKTYEQGQPIDYRKLDYLLRDHVFSYNYSATLMFGTKMKTVSNRKLLAFAPAYEKEELESADTTIQKLRSDLTPLKHTVDEVTEIGKTFDGAIYTQNAATEANFKKKASDYGILHFAMHTMIDDQNPMHSQLVFSRDSSRNEDGYLNLYEIYNLNLNAQMAVLSACETGVGKLNRGEGIMSVARGFIYAGVPGIVMSLWPIEDIASSKIITEFYVNLNSGMLKNQALRNAKLTYINNANQLESHPYYWAAFVQIGDDSAINGNSISKNYLFIGASLILILAVFIFIRRRRNLARD